MKKRKKLVLLGLGLFIGLTGLGAKTQAHAASIPSNYSFDGTKVTGPIPYYTKSAYTKSTSKAYIWNTKHTKRIHNLKNYPSTIWNVSKATVKKVNGKNEIYYQLSSAYNSKISGVAWSGYFAKNLLKLPNLFTSDASYAKYMNSAVSMKIAKGIANLFPNTPISVEFSQDLSGTVAQHDFTNLSNIQFLYFTPKSVSVEDYDRNGNQTNDKVYQSTNTAMSEISDFSESTLTPTQILTQIKSELNQAGLTADKRASLTYYHIGINAYAHAEALDDAAFYKQSSATAYPISGQTSSNRDIADALSNWSIMLANQKNQKLLKA